MTAAAATPGASSVSRSQRDAYRDDGPLARGLGRAFGPVSPLPAAALTLLSPLPSIALLALEGDAVSEVALGAAVAWSVLAGGVANGRPDWGRFGWVVPPLLRLLEYGTLLALAVVAGPPAVSHCFALVGALAFHHYDSVYRLRHQGSPPPAWLSIAGGGWDGRLVVAYVLLVIGALSTGLLAGAIVLGIVYVAESAVSWLRFGQAQRPALYDDEEDEDD